MKNKLALLVETQQDTNYASFGGYGHVKCRIIKIEDDKVRNITYDSYDTDYKDTEFYGALVIGNQTDAHDHGTVCQSYGWSYDYSNMYRVGLYEARKMVKTLAKIEKAMERIESDRGYPQSYGEFVGRISEALKVNTFYFTTKHDSRGDYDSCEFQTLKRGDAISKINHISSNIHEDLKQLAA